MREQMTKADLKTGMILEDRGGNLKVVMLDTPIDGDVVIYTDKNPTRTWSELCRLKEDLTHSTIKDFDVMKVYTCDIASRIMAGDKSYYKLIWERERPAKEISSDEAFEILKKHYGCDVKIIEK